MRRILAITAVAAVGAALALAAVRAAPIRSIPAHRGATPPASATKDVFDLATDRSGSAYIPGQTSSADFPVTPRAFQTTFQGGDLDGYLTKLNPAGTRAIYSTYLGGSGSDQTGTVRVNRHGVAHVAGSTGSTDFPVTPDGFQTANAGGFDVFLVKVALDKSHKGSRQRTGSVTVENSGPREGLTRHRIARR
jgi:hypothetical protein